MNRATIPGGALRGWRGLLLTGLWVWSACTSQQQHPNILFIAVDDLRPALGCYGNSEVKSPNIDRLARQSLLFSRAYCQDAVCGPSRASLLTGLRPDSTGIFDNAAHFRRNVPDVVTLPQFFKTHGYYTQSLGKIFHSSFDRAYVGRTLDDPASWSVPSWFPDVRYYFTDEGVRVARSIFGRAPNCDLDDEKICIHNRRQPLTEASILDPKDPRLDVWTEHFVQGLITEAPDVPDNQLYDGALADRAIETLGKIRDKTFFLGVGFLRPHTPYVAPPRYWNLYDPSRFVLPSNSQPPVDAPPFALLPTHDTAAYEGVAGSGPLGDQMARHLRHGYYACVSMVDHQIGRILEELDKLGLSEKTIVVLWGDHGYHLGELSRWGKQTNFEIATRVPLLIRVPGKTSGEVTQGLVELVDVYPTLASLAGLPLPDHVEGTSFEPLLGDPERPWKTGAFSQFPRPVRVGRPAQDTDLMGYSIRTDRYRLTSWKKVLEPDVIVARELYDHVSDPGETVNLARQPGQEKILRELAKQLEAGWQGSLPPGH